MWIDRRVFEAMQASAQTAMQSTQEARTLAEQNRALQISLDWMRVRVSQLEHERAQMLYQYMGIKIATPEIVRERPSEEHLNEALSFEDVGDKVAGTLGIGWDEHGKVKYT